MQELEHNWITSQQYVLLVPDSDHRSVRIEDQDFDDAYSTIKKMVRDKFLGFYTIRSHSETPQWHEETHLIHIVLKGRDEADKRDNAAIEEIASYAAVHLWQEQVWVLAQPVRHLAITHKRYEGIRLLETMLLRQHNLRNANDGLQEVIRRSIRDALTCQRRRGFMRSELVMLQRSYFEERELSNPSVDEEAILAAMDTLVEARDIEIRDDQVIAITDQGRCANEKSPLNEIAVLFWEIETFGIECENLSKREVNESLKNEVRDTIARIKTELLATRVVSSGIKSLWDGVVKRLQRGSCPARAKVVSDEITLRSG